MSDVMRVMIGSVQMGKTKGGKPIVEFYSTDTRLEYPVLTLFDLSMLETVGIDPNELDSERVHKRFWAYYTESEKTTSRGNPYRDVQYLELIDAPATTTSADNSALLAELRSMNLKLEIVVTKLSTILPQIVLGQDDENADWIADAETRAEEQAIHDELQAQNGNGDQVEAEAVPMGSQQLVTWINKRGQGPECQSVGHLIYCIKKVREPPSWGWPVSDDQEGWNDAAAAWYEYWAALEK